MRWGRAASSGIRACSFFDGLESGFVVALAVVVVKEDEVIPAGMMAVEVDGSLGDGDAAVPFAGEGEHQRHVNQGGTVARIQRHGAVGGFAEGDEIAAEKLDGGEFFPAGLARG